MMSLHPIIGSVALVVLINHGIPASAVSVAAKDNMDAPTTSITTVWCPEDYEEFYTYASVVAADATATTYKLDCARLGDTVDPSGGCSNWPSVTFTAGPSTAEIYASHGGEYYATRGMACDLGPSTAQCDFILQGRGFEAMAKTGRWPMDPINGTEYRWHVGTLTITAGLEKLSGGGGGVSATPVTTTTVSTEAGGAQVTAGVGASTGSSPGLSAASSTGAPTSGAGSVVSRSVGGVVMGLAVLCGVCLLK